MAGPHSGKQAICNSKPGIAVSKSGPGKGRLESQSMLTIADLRLLLAGGVAQGRVMGLAQKKWLG